jgi:hypothetical protein
MRALTAIPLLLAACERGTVDIPTPPLDLVVDSPTYGAFIGDGDAEVRGHVSPATARLWVEGVEVPVAADGAFAANVGVPDPTRVIDVQAWLPSTADEDQFEWLRIPVFDRHDPRDTWIGGLGLRFTDEGLAELGQRLEGTVDGLAVEQQLLALIPAIDTTTFAITPRGARARPSQVSLTPSEAGVAMAVRLRDLELFAEISATIGFEIRVPLRVNIPSIDIGATIKPGASTAGQLTLDVTDPVVSIPDIEVDANGLDLGLLDLLAGLVAGAIDGAGGFIGDLVVGAIPEVPLGTFAFTTDLLGTPLSVKLAQVATDTDGVGLGLQIGTTANLPDRAFSLPLPVPPIPGRRTDAVLVAHEGLLEPLLDSDLFSFLEQSLDVSGIFGQFLGAAISGIPGADDTEDIDGWCVTMSPGAARVARFNPDLSRLAVIHIPDLRLIIEADRGSGCRDWLDASLSLEARLGLQEGTKLGLDLAVVDGAVLAFDSEGYDPDEVVGALGGLVNTLTSLVGGTLSFDLADLLGGLGGASDPTNPLGALTAVQPKLLEATPLVDADGAPKEGALAISMKLWP